MKSSSCFTEQEVLLLQELHEKYKHKGRYRWRYIHFAFNRYSPVKKNLDSLRSKWFRHSTSEDDTEIPLGIPRSELLSESELSSESELEAESDIDSESFVRLETDAGELRGASISNNKEDVRVTEDDHAHDNEESRQDGKLVKSFMSRGKHTPAFRSTKKLRPLIKKPSITSTADNDGLFILTGVRRHLHHQMIWVEDLSFVPRIPDAPCIITNDSSWTYNGAGIGTLPYSPIDPYQYLGINTL